MFFGQQNRHQGFQRGAPVDSAAARKKEEQRRRQQEYAQELAQQVAQREQQKQRERELDRQAGVVGSTHSYRRGNHAPPPPPTANPQQRGFFDGFGSNEPDYRTNFARGQQQQQPPQQQQQPNQPLPTAPWQHHHEPLQRQQPFLEQSFQHQPQWQPSRPPSAWNAGHPQESFSSQQQFNNFAGTGNSPSRWNSSPAQNQWPTPEEYHQYPPGQAFVPSRVNEFGVQQPFHRGSVGAAPLALDGPSAFQGNGSGQNGQGLPIARSPTRDVISLHQNHQQPPPQQPPQQQWGRRVRTDINGVSNTGGENRKMQQQIELQNALQRQIEEKNRQKLEEKRRQEEEDRKEMERLAAEQRAQQQEQERAREEKRRRAEEEMLRAQQAAAAVTAADQRAKMENQQRLRNGRDGSPLRGSPPKDPFTNTRARLFQDPPASQPPEPSGSLPRAHLFQDNSATQLPGGASTFPPIPLTQQPLPSRVNNNVEDHGESQSPNDRPGFQQQQSHDHFYQSLQQPQRRDRGGQFAASPGRPEMMGNHGHYVQSAWGSRELQREMGPTGDGSTPHIDPTVLMRQYDDMRQELVRQQQLMDQLRHAQSELHKKIQLQQQQQQQGNTSPERNSPVPTLTDLDRLRDEPREELEQREQFHRKELDALRRAHQEQQQRQQQQQQQRQLYTQAASPFREQTVLVPISLEPNERPLDGLLRSSSEKVPAPQQVRQLDVASEVLRQQSQTHSPKRQMPGVPVGILKSLECESKLVYFNGSIAKDNGAKNGNLDDRGGKRAVLEPLVEDDGDDTSPDREGDTNDADNNSAHDFLEELNASSISIRPARASSSSPRRNQELTVSLQSSRVFDRNRDNNRPSRAQIVLKSPTRRSLLASAARLSLTRNQAFLDNDDWDDDKTMEEESDDSLEFFVKSYPPMASSRYEHSDSESLSSISLTSRSANLNEQEDEDGNDSDDATMDGEQLEAIFQRNVRRHEILLGFQQRQRQALASFDPGRSPTKAVATGGGRQAWAELHNQLERNLEPNVNASRSMKPSRKSFEPALIGSSRWMPSSLA